MITSVGIYFQNAIDFTTGNQLEVMVKFMEDHPDFANGKLGGPSGRATTIRMWEDLACHLNADGSGPSKTPHKWQKTWIDWKSNTKKKFVKARQHLRGTGGGPPSQITLSNVEERLIAFLGPSGPSAPRKRKGDILMARFVDVEERMFRLEEKKANLEERKVAALELIAASKKEKLRSHQEIAAFMSTFVKSFSELAEGINKFLET
ncbi:hypothetical protein J437_LFUL005660 [Ladona fulva]|uniref:Regulatory protein zeste n=1 Tax=Ladona fulva TaxID=123851 RepID=A0A8K0JZT5_LADFU|nr:hypothetical protein J437_LFUL005660 [Ladona fulva]